MGRRRKYGQGSKKEEARGQERRIHRNREKTEVLGQEQQITDRGHYFHAERTSPLHRNFAKRAFIFQVTV